MAGKLNGLGGEVEPGESPRGAMSREFLEEAGVDINPLDWSGFHTEQYVTRPRHKVHYMCACVADQLIDACQTQVAGEVLVIDLWSDGTLNAGKHRVLNKLSYLIPMAINWINNPDERFFEG